MLMFRVGQKVVCVNAKECGLLIKGQIYTVLSLNPRGCEGAIEVDCAPSSSGCRGYFAWRFRPLVERKTDISVFTKMLTDVKVPV
jgi:hypothetical protein